MRFTLATMAAAAVVASLGLAPRPQVRLLPDRKRRRRDRHDDASACGLMGGGTDVDALFTWMGARAGGGDFVVIRASGADGYNQYVYDLAPFDSVETLVLKNRSASFDDSCCRRSVTPRRCSSPAAISRTTSTTGRARRSKMRSTSSRREEFRSAAPAREPPS